MDVCVRGSTRVSVCVSICVCVCVYLYAHMPYAHMHIYTYMHICTYMHIYTYMHICHVHTCTYMHTYTHIHIYAQDRQWSAKHRTVVASTAHLATGAMSVHTQETRNNSGLSPRRHRGLVTMIYFFLFFLFIILVCLRLGKNGRIL
jgi:hypothetical protein